MSSTLFSSKHIYNLGNVNIDTAAPLSHRPFNLWVDQAKYFMLVQIKTLTSSLGCIIIFSAVEAHWSSITERYHDPVRRNANKLFIDQPKAPLELLIDYVNLAISHTTGLKVFTPTILASVA